MAKSLVKLTATTLCTGVIHDPVNNRNLLLSGQKCGVFQEHFSLIVSPEDADSVEKQITQDKAYHVVREEFSVSDGQEVALPWR